MEHAYIAIDLKSFYASVECVERGLDPLTTNLVVADNTRTDKTICLAVSAGLKTYGLPGRPRLFEVIQAVRQLNAERRSHAPQRRFTGRSYLVPELEADPSLELDYITAVPRMLLYMQYSTRIYGIYLRYVAPEDIHVYSCDEVFIDATQYLKLYNKSAHDLAITMIRDVLAETGITATAGIGTNLFLSKVAMDIVAKHMPADKDGVRIADLDERIFRESLWDHTPITDFWRIGGGTARRLYKLGLVTMGDIARYSEYGESHLYKTFGINAELLIDHAWGWEPVTIECIKQYRPATNSLSSGQVLQRPYSYDECMIIIREMTDQLALDLVRGRLVTDQLVLYIGYECIRDPELLKDYKGELHLDYYGRITPKHANGTANIHRYTSSSRLLTSAVLRLYKAVVDPQLLIRRVNICACRVVPEASVKVQPRYEQLDLFTDFDEIERAVQEEDLRLQKEKALQLAALKIKEKYGKNSLLKGTDFLEGAMARQRNQWIGGHKA